jgi:type VI secretion system secreted protein Hcp
MPDTVWLGGATHSEGVMASIDTHIKFAGIDGESTHKDHKGEIEVLSWTWHVANESGGSGGGSGKGKAVPGEFEFSHLYDKASPVLAKHCASGKHFDSVTMTARKAGDGQRDFLVFKLKEAVIKSVRVCASAQGDTIEEVAVGYKQIDVVYRRQDDKGGMFGDIRFGWNHATTEVN